MKSLTSFNLVWRTAAENYLGRKKRKEKSGADLASLSAAAAVIPLLIACPIAVNAQDGGIVSRADFEFPFYVPGNIDGQGGWRVDQGRAEIVEGQGRGGGSGLALLPGDPFTQARLSLPSDMGPQEVSFVDVYIRATAVQFSDSGEMLDVSSARVGLFRTEEPSAAALWVFHGDLLGGGAWRETPLRIPVDPATGRSLEWHRLTVRADRANQLWDVWLDGVEAASDLGFQDQWSQGDGNYIFMGDSVEPLLLDDLSVSDSEPFSMNGSGPPDSLVEAEPAGNDEDRDSDGLPDSWEAKYGLGEGPNSAGAGDFDGDGISNRNELLLGLNPAGKNNPADHLPPPSTEVFNSIQVLVIKHGQRVERSGMAEGHSEVTPQEPEPVGPEENGN